MRLVLHQFKTDLRHLRFWLIAFWGTLFVQVFDASRFKPENYINLFTVVPMLLAIVLVVRLVQSDTWVETNAFWMTRPIGRVPMFLSKTAFIVLLLGAPYLLAQSLCWFWHFGITFDMWMRASIKCCLYMTFFLGTVAALAAVTNNWRGFLLLGLGVTGAFIFSTALIALKIKWFDYDERVIRELFVYSILAVFSVTAWALQTLGRLRKISVSILMLAALSAMPIYRYWPVQRLDIPRSSTPAISGVSVKALSTDDSTADKPGTQVLWSLFRIDGLRSNQLVCVRSASGWFEPKNLQGFRFAGEAASPPEAQSHSGSGSFELMKGVQTLYPPETLWFSESSDYHASSLYVESTNVIVLKDQPRGHFSAQLNLDLFELHKAVDLPLQPATVIFVPGQQLKIKNVTSDTGNIRVDLGWATMQRLVETDLGFQSAVCRVYVLYHPSFGDAYVCRPVFAQPWQTPSGWTGPRSLTFPYPAIKASLTGTSVQDWLKGARLQIFQAVKLGNSTFDLSEENFAFNLERSTQRKEPVNGISEAEANNAARTAIRNAVLPPNPSKSQIHDYLEIIINNSRQWDESSKYNLIEEKLEAIGETGMPILIGLLPCNELYNPYSTLAFPRSHVTREHLPELREALKRDLRLATLFREKHWEEDARDVLVAQLSDHATTFPPDALVIAASAKDPSTYGELAWHFVQLKRGHGEVVNALKECPGFDVAGTVAQAWQRARLGIISADSLCGPAAAFGLPEALAHAVRKMVEGGLDSAVLVELTGYTGPKADFQKWVLQNLKNLRYDAAQKHYMLSTNSP